MSPLQERTSPVTSDASSPSRRLTALGRATALALLGLALLHSLQLLIIWSAGGKLLLLLLALIIVTGLSAGLVAARMRWAPFLGALIALLTSGAEIGQPIEIGVLLHPVQSIGEFSLLIIMDACALVAIGAGVAATIQNYQSRDRTATRWLSSLLVGLSSIVVGMIVVAFLVAANPPSSSASPTTNGLPTVHMAGDHFLTNVVLVPKGGKLRLIDDDGVEHIMQNGFWTPSGTPSSVTESGAPVVQNLQLKGGSADIGPFPTAGVFHLYCTIHRGMNLTIVVQ